MERGHSILLAQWDGEKNAPLTPAEKNAPLAPSDVTVGSHQLIWWRCEKGHSYRSAVKTRIQGSGCPYCAGRLALPGLNTLVERAPALAEEWDAEKNAPLTPEQVLAGTRRKVWWRCAKGHSWQAAVVSRTKMGSNCPYCNGQAVLPGVNDLAVLYPTLMSEWDWVKNGSLSPETLRPYSNRRVWLSCPLGHSYAAVIAARTTRKSGCPYCAGRKVLAGFNDLEAKAPVVAAQWHPTLNAPLTPQQVTYGSSRKVWWICPLGHVWKATIASRTGKQQCGCPVCAGRTIDKYSTAGSRGVNI